MRYVSPYSARLQPLIQYPAVVLIDNGRNHSHVPEGRTNITEEDREAKGWKPLMFRDMTVVVDDCEWRIISGLKFDFRIDADMEMTLRIPSFQVVVADQGIGRENIDLPPETEFPYVEIAWKGEPFISDLLACRIDGINRPITSVKTGSLVRDSWTEITMAIFSLDVR